MCEFDRVGSLDADFHLFKLSEIFTVLLRNMNHLKSVKKSKNIFFFFFQKKKILFILEIA